MVTHGHPLQSGKRLISIKTAYHSGQPTDLVKPGEIRRRSAHGESELFPDLATFTMDTAHHSRVTGDSASLPASVLEPFVPRREHDDPLA